MSANNSSPAAKAPAKVPIYTADKMEAADQRVAAAPEKR